MITLTTRVKLISLNCDDAVGPTYKKGTGGGRGVVLRLVCHRRHHHPLLRQQAERQKHRLR